MYDKLKTTLNLIARKIHFYAIKLKYVPTYNEQFKKFEKIVYTIYSVIKYKP